MLHDVQMVLESVTAPEARPLRHSWRVIWPEDAQLQDVVRLTHEMHVRI